MGGCKDTAEAVRGSPARLDDAAATNGRGMVHPLRHTRGDPHGGIAVHSAQVAAKNPNWALCVMRVRPDGQYVGQVF